MALSREWLLTAENVCGMARHWGLMGSDYCVLDCCLFLCQKLLLF